MDHLGFGVVLEVDRVVIVDRDTEVFAPQPVRAKYAATASSAELRSLNTAAM